MHGRESVGSKIMSSYIACIHKVNNDAIYESREHRKKSKFGGI